MNTSVILSIVLSILLIAMQFRKCPPKHILVVYSKIKKKPIIKKVLERPTFIIPLLQDSITLVNEQISTRIDLYNIQTFEKNEMNFSFIYTVKISKKPKIMQNAIIEFAGKKIDYIMDRIRNTIQNRLIDEIKNLTIREIGNTEKFIETTKNGVEEELKNLGYELTDFILVDARDGDN